VDQGNSDCGLVVRVAGAAGSGIDVGSGGSGGAGRGLRSR
jgi:hypothetical protein